MVRIDDFHSSDPGSFPGMGTTNSTLGESPIFALITQLVEWQSYELQVEGSSPSKSTYQPISIGVG